VTEARFSVVSKFRAGQRALAGNRLPGGTVKARNDRLSQLRQGQTEAGNHVIDEFVAGRLTRRELLRRGALVGISAPVLGGILAACGSSPTSSPSSSAGKANQTINVGTITPATAINPLLVDDQGGLEMLGQTGEYLTLSTQDLSLKPMLATKWTPNSTSDVWTFDIRTGVKFHDGTPLTADDVVYSYQLQSNTKTGGNALSAFGGVLDPAGVVKVDDYTVAFHLEAPNGNFPYLTSSDNYNMIIIPKGYDPAKWQSSFIGTGPFVMTSYTLNKGATFARNPHYWGALAKPKGTNFTFYATQTPAVLALTSGSIDVLAAFSVSGGQQLLNNSSYNVIRLKSSAHRELSMRCDTPPFTDARVRQAIALTLNRPQIIQGLFMGYADLGNDSPFAPVFPSTNTSVPQRVQDISKAKSLLAAAGHPRGFSTQLIGLDEEEIPDFAQIVAQSAKAIGVDISVKVEASSAYYGSGDFGSSNWLDATMSLVDYGHRSVPNVFLTAPLQTINSKTGTGAWNAAHFNNAQYDKLSNEYIATSDLTTQRTIAGKIETLLLAETPIIFAYFYNWLSATASTVTGAYPTAIGHIFLQDCVKS
jgi:peptide/nickel transport system substrate-binding protein